jgi:multidrug efflux pump subunit AcrA (membrane-fusion protein)
VLDVKVDVGTRVKKGDILATLDPRDASLRSKQAAATQEQALAKLGMGPGQKFDPAQVPDVRAAKEAMDYAVADADRTKQLVESGTTSQAAWDQARTTAEQRKAQYDAALANAKQSWASLAGAQAASGLASKQVADSTIRAPFDGSVAEKRVSPGEYAAVGRVIAVVVHDNPLRLKVDVAESDLSKVQVGRKVDVQVSAFPDKTFPGTISRLGAALKQTSRTLPIEADVPNNDGTLRPGLFAKATIVVPGADQKAMLVPESALGSTGANSRVFVKQGTKVVEKLVKPGRHVGGMVEVIGGGLTDADEVATTNVEQLADGADVTSSP